MFRVPETPNPKALNPAVLRRLHLPEFGKFSTREFRVQGFGSLLSRRSVDLLGCCCSRSGFRMPDLRNDDPEQ